MKGRRDIINYFINKNQYKSYLEVGLYGASRTFDHINCKFKNSIDPNPACKAEFEMTSDEFFSKLDNNELSISPSFKWDIVFLDGDHHYSTVDRDIQNSLNHLSENGTIIMHDCLYGDNTITRANPRGTNVWKSWVKLRCSRTDLKMYVVNIDWGVGIIHHGEQNIWNKAPIDECITDEYFTSLVNQDDTDPFASYTIYNNGQFLLSDSKQNITGYLYSTHENLTRTHLLPLIDLNQFYEIYE